MFRYNVSISGCREFGIHIPQIHFYFAMIWHKCFHTPVFEIISTLGDVLIPAETCKFSLHVNELDIELYVGWVKYVYYRR